MEITKNLDIKKFAQIVYEISMMAEVGEKFFVRDIFSKKQSYSYAFIAAVLQASLSRSTYLNKSAGVISTPSW